MIKEIIDTWQRHPLKGKAWYDTVNTQAFQEVVSMARLAVIEESTHHIEGLTGNDFLVAQSSRMSFIEGYNQALIFLQRLAKETKPTANQPAVDDYDPAWVEKYNTTQVTQE